MKTLNRFLWLIAISFLFQSQSISYSFAGVYFSKLFTSLPGCDEARVLLEISERFNRADAILWRNGVRLRYISAAYEHANNIFPESSINRRYCRAKAKMSDGGYRKVYYVVEQGMGLIGTRWNVEYCLRGSDGWHAYGGWCRVLRK